LCLNMNAISIIEKNPDKIYLLDWYFLSVNEGIFDYYNYSYVLK
jgi:hypothetical protein